MKTWLAILAVSFAVACDSAPPAAGTPRAAVGVQDKVRDDFEKDNPKWSFAEGKWERKGGVLVQSAAVDAWAVAVLREKTFADVDVSVKVKPVSGQEDQTGGLIFRAKDAKNYYLVRSNGLEDNFRLYTMTDGNRKQIASTKVEPPKAGEWHTLRVVAKGSKLQAYVGAKLLIDHEDVTFKSGFVGLWTKADSVTEFDDFEASGTP
ncbi:MAG TPA: family 16 glycoside hydrolase [Planctomycetota bacterium]